MEEDHAIRLFVSGKITESQLDLQRRFITERLESARAKLDDYLARDVNGSEKRRLMEAVLAWAREVGQGLDDLTPEQRKEILQMILEAVIVHKDNNVDITLAIPFESEPATEDCASVQTLANVQNLEPSFDGLNRHGKLKCSWEVGLGPFKQGRIFGQ